MHVGFVAYLVAAQVVAVHAFKGFDKRLFLAPLVLAVIILGGFVGYRYFNAADSEQVKSIAVLPFENRSGDADTDYLSDGLADSLIYRLSQLPNLKVSSTRGKVRPTRTTHGTTMRVKKFARRLTPTMLPTNRA